MSLSTGAAASARLRVATGVAVVVLLAGGLVAVGVRGWDGSTEAVRAPVAGSTGTGPPATTEPVPPTLPPAADDEPPEIREIRAQVAALRGLQWKAPLKVAVVPPDELVRRIREVNARDIDPARLAGEGATYKLLGVIPRDLDYAKALDNLFSALVLGFYDPITKEMFVRDSGEGSLGPNTKRTIAHELNHALTDQHFDFGSKLDALDDAGRDEEAYAFVALIEGDARLVDQLWMSDHLSEDEQVEILLGGVDPSAVATIPEFMLETLNFPYTEGLEFVTEQVDAGGFARVDQEYGRPPTSTEQILHPELYAAGQGWTPPPLPDLAASTGCAPVHRGTIGEFQMSKVLDSELGAEESRAAARGWNGDSYQVVRCGAAMGMVDRWVADDEGAATRLAAALSGWSAEWAGSGGGPGADGRFAGSNGSGRLVRRGAQVDLVLASDRPTADRLAAAVG